jgi:hypothetical protein
MIAVPRPFVGLVGRAFFRAVRRFPVIFLLCCVGGLVVGIAALFLFGERPNARDAFFCRLIGVGCILFYGWLALLFVLKMRRGSWRDFCDWGYGVFKDM